MAIKNHFKMTFDSLSENVGIARLTAAAFAAQLDFTINEIEEIKVAVSEAISNSVIHGYGNDSGDVELVMKLYDDRVEYIVIDKGRGIEDIEQARQPSYSSDPERMGLGFVFMETFMDELVIETELQKGTIVRMIKKVQLNKAH
ncbi:Anti-sigma F factor [bioreactor metagenome]|uniref:Anti-sigma F factor n=1 Tax=bioreactor metagenome TaxID=1076179 RepID=A0A644T018_9ZZZZ|nr:anti-sigma F factor [Negativicutes bacterium]